MADKNLTTHKTEPLPHWIASLDLANLPERLDDKMLEAVKVISSTFPAPIPSEPSHVKKCLRVMLAVLPKRSLDEVSGELFVAAYVKKLGEFSAEKVSFITERAMEQCKWFPTIAECIEIGGGFRRNDLEFHRFYEAKSIVTREENARMWDERRRKEAEKAARMREWIEGKAEWDFGTLPPFDFPKELVELGLEKGLFIRHPKFGVIHHDDYRLSPKINCRKCQDIGLVLNWDGEEEACGCGAKVGPF